MDGCSVFRHKDTKNNMTDFIFAVIDTEQCSQGELGHPSQPLQQPRQDDGAGNVVP